MLTDLTDDSGASAHFRNRGKKELTVLDPILGPSSCLGTVSWTMCVQLPRTKGIMIHQSRRSGVHSYLRHFVISFNILEPLAVYFTTLHLISAHTLSTLRPVTVQRQYTGIDTQRAITTPTQTPPSRPWLHVNIKSINHGDTGQSQVGHTRDPFNTYCSYPAESQCTSAAISAVWSSAPSAGHTNITPPTERAEIIVCLALWAFGGKLHLTLLEVLLEVRS